MSLDALGRTKRFKNRPARLLHVGPLRLDEAAPGLPGLPEKLRNLNATAAHAAMIRVFDAAIEHRVDAVLLSDGFPDPDQIGFRGLALAYEQCRRLVEHQIPVIAAEDPTAAEARFRYLRKPTNVHFANDSSRNAVTIGDAGRRGRLDIGTPEMVSNARLRVIMAAESVANGRLNLRTDAEYIALGHQPNATNWSSKNKTTTTWDAGSPQGRGCGETGPHGALLVTMSRGEQSTVQQIACDIVRHHDIELAVDTDTTYEQIHRQMWSQTESIRSDHSVLAHITHWKVRGHGPGWQALNSFGVQTELINELRNSFATPASGPSVWIASLDHTADNVQFVLEREDEDHIGRFVASLESQRPRHRESAVTWVAPLLI